MRGITFLSGADSQNITSAHCTLLRTPPQRVVIHLVLVMTLNVKVLRVFYCRVTTQQ